MAESFSHYVKFARSLALTSTLVLQACSGSPDTGEPGDQPPPPAPPAPTATTPGDPSARHGAAAAAAFPASDADAGPPPDAGFVSGPLPPPELPASFA